MLPQPTEIRPRKSLPKARGNLALCLQILLGDACPTHHIEDQPFHINNTSIYIVFSIFNVFNVTMNNIVSSEGAAKTAMCALMAGAILNVILDLIFVYSFGYGIAGAAIATAISQMVSTAVYLIYIFRKTSMFSFSTKRYSFAKNIMSEVLKTGIPTLVFQILTSVSLSMINGAAKEYGSSALAAMGPVAKIMSMSSLVVFGF